MWSAAYIIYAVLIGNVLVSHKLYRVIQEANEKYTAYFFIFRIFFFFNFSLNLEIYTRPWKICDDFFEKPEVHLRHNLVFNGGGIIIL